MAPSDDNPAQRASTDAVRLPDSNNAGVAAASTPTNSVTLSAPIATDYAALTPSEPPAPTTTPTPSVTAPAASQSPADSTPTAAPTPLAHATTTDSASTQPEPAPTTTSTPAPSVPTAMSIDASKATAMATPTDAPTPTTPTNAVPTPPFKDDIEALRQWKRSTIPTFKQFLMTKVGKKYMVKKRAHGADDRMACGYNAVGIALELLGLPNHVTKSSIEEFRAIGANRRKISAEEYEKRGVVWPALSKFIEQLGLVEVDVINKNLYYGDGSGVDSLQKLNLEDGVYIVSGCSTERIGHCFVLEVTCGGTGGSVHDTEGLEDVNWLRQWLSSVSFVRRVEPLKK